MVTAQDHEIVKRNADSRTKEKLMADKNWRTNPDIQLAKRIAVQKQADAAIVLCFMPDGHFDIASYGADGDRCKAVGKITDQIHRKLCNGEIDSDDLMEIIG